MAALSTDKISGTDSTLSPLTKDGLEILIADRAAMKEYIQDRFTLVDGRPIPAQEVGSLALNACASLKKRNGACCYLHAGCSVLRLLVCAVAPGPRLPLLPSRTATAALHMPPFPSLLTHPSCFYTAFASTLSLWLPPHYIRPRYGVAARALDAVVAVAIMPRHLAHRLTVCAPHPARPAVAHDHATTLVYPRRLAIPQRAC